MSAKESPSLSTGSSLGELPTGRFRPRPLEPNWVAKYSSTYCILYFDPFRALELLKISHGSRQARTDGQVWGLLAHLQPAALRRAVVGGAAVPYAVWRTGPPNSLCAAGEPFSEMFAFPTCISVSIEHFLLILSLKYPSSVRPEDELAANRRNRPLSGSNPTATPFRRARVRFFRWSTKILILRSDL
jgi:hypothetical protein